MANRSYKAMDCGVYAITHIESGKRYIGSSRRIKERFTEHRNLLKRQDHGNCHLQSAWNMYGEKSFQFSTVLVCNKDDRVFYEQRVIDGLGVIDKSFGYNLSPTASHATHSEETIAKIKAAVAIAKSEGRIPGHRKPHTEEAKQRIREALAARKGIPRANKGRVFSQEIRENMRKGKIAQYQDPEFLVRHNARKATHCKRGHAFSGENLYLAPDGERGCRSCMRMNNRNWEENNRERYLACRRASYQKRKNNK